MIRALCSLGLFLFGLAISFSLRGAPKSPDALAEGIVLTPQSGTTLEDAEILRCQQRLLSNADQSGAWERLGWAYIAKARRTLDAGYYKLAEKTADAMDARFSPSVESRLLRGHIWHNLHRFREAE